MASSEFDRALRRMREAVENHTYILTPHALLEMQQDQLDVVDVESAILTGHIARAFDDDPRGRYEVIGTACDLTTHVGVVARFVGSLLIITVYEIKP